MRTQPRDRLTASEYHCLGGLWSYTGVMARFFHLFMAAGGIPGATRVWLAGMPLGAGVGLHA